MKPVEVVIAALGIMLGATIGHLQVERPHPSTPKAWTIHELPRAYTNGGNISLAKIDVIDTQGVCLYVARSWADGNQDSTVAITAVPKTQLPTGSGCQ